MDQPARIHKVGKVVHKDLEHVLCEATAGNCDSPPVEPTSAGRKCEMTKHLSPQRCAKMSPSRQVLRHSCSQDAEKHWSKRASESLSAKKCEGNGAAKESLIATVL